MWPSISLILLIILANSIHCHLDDSEHDFSHHELQPRATPGDGFTFDIADTDLVVTITFAARIITDIVRHGLLTVLDQKASSMAPNENPSRIIIWPKIEDDLYFSGVFEIVHQCPDPPLNVALLQGLRKGIGEYFQTHPDENLAFNFYGYITSKSDLSSNLFAFRMSFANPGVLRSEKKDGVHLGLPDLNVIYDVKRRILELTEPDDLVLFIGNTASYFYYALKPNDKINAHLIPYSGDPIDPVYGELLPSSIQGFKKRILDPAFASFASSSNKKKTQRLILVDHIRTGKSIDAFVSILHDTGLIPMDGEGSKPLVINLAYKNLYANHISWALDIITLAVIPVGETDEDFERLDLGLVGRLLPYYSKELWVYDWREVPTPDEKWRDNNLRLIKERGVIHGAL